MTTRRERTVLLRGTDLHLLADELLGPVRGDHDEARWACPRCAASSEPSGSAAPAPSLRIVLGAPDRWVCERCRDGGTALDLRSLVRARPGLADLSPPDDARPVGGVAVSVVCGDVVSDALIDPSPAATVADLGLVWGRGLDLTIDGVRHPPSTLLRSTSLGPGSVLSLSSAVAPAPAEGTRHVPVSRLRWMAGLDAGTEHDLFPGQHVLGSSPDADLALVHAERHQALVDVRPNGSIGVRALGTVPVEGSGGSQAGVIRAEPGGWLSVGTAFARVEHAIEPDVEHAVGPDHAGAGGPVPGSPVRSFNRPPRPSPAKEPAAIQAPCSADERAGRSVRVGSLSILVSLVGGLVVAVLFRQPLLLLMAGIGALGVLATSWQQRRVARREQRHTAREAAADLVRFETEVDAAHRLEVAARHRRAGPAEAVRIARGDSSLWERRPGHSDAFRCVVGFGDEPWGPTLTGPNVLSGAAQLALARRSVLADVPCQIDLTPRRTAAGVAPQVVGLVGPRAVTRAVARSLLVQLAVFHGPADLAVAAVVATEGDDDDPLAPWRWTRWMPHARADDGGEPLLAHGERATETLIAQLPARPLVVVVDGPSLATTCNAGARPLLTGRHGEVCALVLADRIEELPAVCTTIIDASAQGTARWWRPADSAPPRSLELVGVPLAVAEQVARDLGRLRDPELTTPGSELPAAVSLVELLGTDSLTPDTIVAGWSTLGPDPVPRAPIALAVDGPVVLDLDRDGPHALVAGTTGSGKSELLRTFVASFAVCHRPEDVTFVLIDYKGGSAFDACSGLPHVVGVVTDLDDSLAHRALTSLEAELRHREHLLREVGAADLAAYRNRAREPLPRLVVVVDEFAALASDLPDFLASLVGVAQRGRSLGIHLVLATQRPAGAVSDDIRANTNLRLALRVHDAADSIDVIGDASAATLHRRQPGRALLRLGPGELVMMQAARVTGPALQRAATVIVHELVAGAWLRIDGGGPSGAGSHLARSESGSDTFEDGRRETELDVLVRSVSEAHRRRGGAMPRRPWLDALPTDLPLASLPAGSVALADEPAEQRQPLVTWRPDDGNLLLVGSPGSGTTTAVASLVLALDAVCLPHQLHVYVIDHGAGALAPLAELATVGAVVLAGEHERLVRLVRTVAAELVRRRAQRGDWPDLVLVIDGLGALRAAWDDPAGYEHLDALERIASEGAQVGIRVVATIDRPGALPMSLTGSMADQWLFRLADRTEGAALGVPAAKVPTLPGRALQIARQRVIQVANPGPDLASAVRAIAPGGLDGTTAQRARAEGGAPAIGVLPNEVLVSDLDAPTHVDGRLEVPVGIGDRALASVSIGLHAGDHVLVAGPARSGRTTALAVLATQIARADPTVHLVGVTLRRSALVELATFAEVVITRDQLTSLRERIPAGRRAVVVVDDADVIDDVHGVLAALAADDTVSLVVAGRPDVLRAYGHWTQVVRRSRLGVLLRPQSDADGDLLGVALPRRRPPLSVPGRGYLVTDGGCELVQLARTGGGPADRGEPG